MHCWKGRKKFLTCSASGTKLICLELGSSSALDCVTNSFRPVSPGSTVTRKDLSNDSPLYTSGLCIRDGFRTLPPPSSPPPSRKARRTSPVSSPESAIRNAKFSTCEMASRRYRRLGPTGIRWILGGCRANHSWPAASLKREYDAVVIGAGERQRNGAHLTHAGAKEVELP